ncbi:MAG: hypothetical protein K0R05_3538 [Anaerocolumna sp.]|jgi:pyruvate formate lyase activating enzyme|nr:hypothetical protein [Anaerocolumna sp.]
MGVSGFREYQIEDSIFTKGVIMKIHGFQKTTLLDYPGHLAATIFFGGCNFLCPYCHNGSLVLCPDSLPLIPKDDVLNTLKKRRGIIEGVCITGGEPTLAAGLTDFITEIKELGFLVKLDTNGSNPARLKELVLSGLIDYVAMDIKNSRNKYVKTIGKDSYSTEKISESVDFLLTDKVSYEFRTTVTKELHTPADFLAIGEWIKGAKAYYLQSYKVSEDVISPVFSGYAKEELMLIQKSLLPFVEKVEIRGLD